MNPLPLPKYTFTCISYYHIKFGVDWLPAELGKVKVLKKYVFLVDIENLNANLPSEDEISAKK